MSAPDTQAPLLLTVKEACTRLQVGHWTLYKLIHSNQLETIKLGRSRRIPAAALDALVDRLRQTGGTAL
jgi:excisionase family DNA binding protein